VTWAPTSRLHGDCAAQYPCGQCSEDALRLSPSPPVDFEGSNLQAGYRVSDIYHPSRSTLKATASPGKGVLGHGVGPTSSRTLKFPIWRAGAWAPLFKGMTRPSSPCHGRSEAIRVLDDDWTVITADGVCSPT
jgi:methionyl aminopeptidase